MIQNQDLLAQYMRQYGNVGNLNLVRGAEGGADQWFAPGGQQATQNPDGTFTINMMPGVDPNGTPGRGSFAGHYDAQGKLIGDPYYQQSTKGDYTSGAMILGSALGAQLLSGAGALGAGASGGAPISASQIAALGPSATAADIAQFAAQGGSLAAGDYSSAGSDGGSGATSGGGPGQDFQNMSEWQAQDMATNPGVTPPIDQVGSDWAAGAPTGKVGGALATTAGGLTAANTAAAAAGSALPFGMTPADIAKLGSAAVGLASAASAAGAPTSATTQSRTYIDPRVETQVWGGEGSQWGPNGITGQIAQGAQQPLPSGVTAAGTMANEYLSGGNAGQDLSATRNAINRQLTPNAYNAPQMTAAQSQGTQAQGTQAQGSQVQTPTGLLGGVVPQAQQMSAAQINAPAQNNLNLTDYYKGILGANPGTNPFLTDTLSAAAKQARGDFGNLLGDITSNFQEQIIPQIRGAAIQAGGLGGSRNAMSEAIAARDLNRRALSTAENVQNNINSSMFGQLASSYNQGADRQANLLNSLSGQQYGVGTNNAGFQQGAGQTNATLGTQAGISGAGNQTSIIGAQNNNLWNQATNNANLAQGNSQFNATLGQGNNQFNATLGQGNNQFNATAQNNASANNMQSQLGTNSLNSSNLQNGINNMGNFQNNQVNTSYQAWNAPWQRTMQGAQTAQPWYQMFNGQNVTTPVAQANPVASGVGAALGTYGLLRGFGWV